MALFIKKLENPRFSVIFVSIIYFVLIFLINDPRALYGDSGIMFLQVHDIVNSNFSTFAFHYPAEMLDPGYLMVPFKEPFLARVGDNYYIDFPPYFPLLNSLFYLVFSYTGLYLLNYVSLVGSILVMSYLPELIGLRRVYGHLMVLLYSFGTTATLYSLFFHEYTLAIFLVTVSLYLMLKYLYHDKRYAVIAYSGFIGGLALFFRLEVVFLFLIAGIVILFYNKRIDWKSAMYFGAAFSVPFLILLYLNNEIHGHPLGLRYALTMKAKDAVGSVSSADRLVLVDVMSADTSRFGIIVNTLFSKMRGLFYQSPFFVLPLFSIFYFVNKRSEVKKLIPLAAIFLGGMLLILFTAPNHGDHFAPRYLFGLFPFGILLFFYITNDILNFVKIRHKSLRITAVAIILILVLHSVNVWKKKYIWIRSLDSMVLKAEEVIHNQKESVIAFIEYASSRNLLLGFTEKKMVVIDDLSRRDIFLNALVDNNIKSFAIVLPVAGKSGESTMEKYFTDGKPDAAKLALLSPILNPESRTLLTGIEYDNPFVILRYRIRK